MRRSMHSLIVALLCLTLFVDSAKACWWLRQQRSRAQVCRPAVCRPMSPPPCDVMPGATVAHDMVSVEAHADCLCNVATVEDTAICQTIESTLEQAAVHAADEPVIEQHLTEQPSVEQVVVEHGADEQPTRADESVVVHSPTIVVDAGPAQPAPGGPAGSSVVIAPATDTPSPAAARPMPAAAAGPAVLPTPTASREPIPDLKPAVAPQSPVAPASNEQPVPEPQASAEAPAPAAEAAIEEAPMPAPVDDLAGGPDVKPASPEPEEPNLFDLYGDEGDDDVAPSDEPSADIPPEEVDDAAGEPAEESAESPLPDAEPEMTDDDAAAVEAEADEGASEPAAPATAVDEPSAEDADDEAAPEAESEQSEQPEADPAEAAMAVPNEPMRRWANDTGTHQAQGWLVEVRADRVRILKVNGRHTTMLKESLSAADRDYVSAVGARLAAEGQGTSPAPSTTAGL